MIAKHPDLAEAVARAARIHQTLATDIENEGMKDSPWTTSIILHLLRGVCRYESNCYSVIPGMYLCYIKKKVDRIKCWSYVNMTRTDF